MSIALGMAPPLAERDWHWLSLTIATGFACAIAAATTLPMAMDTISAIPGPLCAVDASSGSQLNKVEVITSHALPNVPGKRVTVVRVTYGPGGFTPPHRHGGSVTAYITKGQVRSQLQGGPLETFEVGQSFFEPPGATHLVSANASNTEPAELIAVFVADEGAELTTFVNR
jgi:quercetin dioxygenase-like cupin family protein